MRVLLSSRRVKKPCAGCGKQIPETALHCVFCGAKQSGPEEAAAAAVSEAVPSTLGEALQRAAEGAPVEAAPAAPEVAAHSSKTGVTLMGLRIEDVQAAMREQAAEGGAPLAPLSLDPTPQRGLPVIDPPTRLSGLPQAAAEGSFAASLAQSPQSALVRLVMASGGLVLVALFSLPWRGASSWQLLETLAGADFVRQLFFLAGGAVLFTTAILPVPNVFRAVIGASVAALPVVLGFEGLLAGWRGCGAALAIIALPATHLVRTRQVGRLDGVARALVVGAAVAITLIYLLPVSSVVPVVFIGRLLGSMSVTHTALGLFIAIPLVLAALSLLGALGRDMRSVAVLLSVLILLWAPAAMLIFVDDGTQLYLALALLWTSAIAALCLAQLLTLAAVTATRRT